VRPTDSQSNVVVPARGNPTVEVELDSAHRPIAATATQVIAAPRERLWRALSDVETYPGLVPMLDKVKRVGDRFTVSLRFRVSLFSAGFEFTADAVRDEGRCLELRWVAGEPRAINLRFELEDAEGGTCVRARITFDVDSLGWLTRYFLRHHPEIRFGIFPGSACALIDSFRRAAELQR
jgi:carbon monoxide dehydrogenase subunit G